MTREHVVPPAGVQPGRVLAQLVEDLLHLEGGRVGLDEHRRADRADAGCRGRPARARTRRSTAWPRGGSPSSAGRSTGPGRRRAASARSGRSRARSRSGCRRSAGRRPGCASPAGASRAAAPRWSPTSSARRVALALRRGEVDPPVDGVAQVELALDHVLPERGVGVLEVGQPDPGAGVQRVDRHLAVGRSGDLGPPVDQPGRRLGDPPRLVLADVLGLGEEVEGAAGGELGVALLAQRQQLAPATVETTVQVGEEAPAPRR